MKRKVARVSKVRLSPNEEAILVKNEYERRRKLRLQQVREQERNIALQIRQEVKQRKEEQLQKLAEQLKAEWLSAQAQKAALLEKMYVSSLEAVGEGHRQAKENEPDLKTLAEKVAVYKRRAMVRHRDALRELKFQKDKEKEEQTRYILARKHALLVEKERASKIASLPPPSPDPIDEIQMAKYPAVKFYDIDSFSVSHYHLPEPCVYRETDIKQTDAKTAAAQEAQRLEGLKMEGERGRREQMEKARLRGSHALRMVHLEQDRKRLMKELEQMQHVDLERRRQIVSQMPPQLFEPPYRRMEIKDDWQRELEFAFEDMYTGEKRVKGDLILRLEPHPLPLDSAGTQDEDLDLSFQPEIVENIEQQSAEEQKEEVLSDKAESVVAPQAPSKLALKKLLNKIRTQKDTWTSRSTESSDRMTTESGPFSSEERHPAVVPVPVMDVKSAPHQSLPYFSQECEAVGEEQIVAGNTTLLHPKEQAILIRSVAEKRKQALDIETQTQEQLTLLQQLEDQKRRLEAHYQQIHSEREQIHVSENIPRKNIEVQLHFPYQDAEHVSEQHVMQTGLIQTSDEVGVRDSVSQVPSTVILHANAVTQQENVTSSENENEDSNHLQTIHQYQQHLIEQNRLHKQSIEVAWKQLREYQMFLKTRYASVARLQADSSTVDKLNDRLFLPATVHFEVPASQSRTVSFLPGLTVSASQKEKTLSACLERLANVPVTAAINSIVQPKLSTTESGFASLRECPLQSDEKEMNQKIRDILIQDAVNAEFKNSSDIINGNQGTKVEVVRKSRENRLGMISSHNEMPLQPVDKLDALQNSSSMTQEGFSLLQAGLQAKQLGVVSKPEKYSLIKPSNPLSAFALQATDDDDAVLQNEQNLKITSSSSLTGMLLEKENKPMQSIKPLDVLPPGEIQTNMTSLVTAQTLVKGGPMESLCCEQKSCAASERGSSKSTAEEGRLFYVHHQSNMDVYPYLTGELVTQGAAVGQEVMLSPSNFVALHPQQNLLISLQEMEARQKQIRSLQEQLEKQHESVLARQKLQEETLLCRRDYLKEQLRKQQEILDNALLGNQNEETRTASIESSIQNMQKRDLMSSFLKALEESGEDGSLQKRDEECGHLNTDDLDEWRASFEHTENSNHTDDFQRMLGRGHQRNRKPPVTKTKLGLMGILEQHELSVIPEVETPNERLSIWGKPDVTTEVASLAVAADFESSKLEHGSPMQDLNLSRISASSRETLTESINDDSSSVKLTWRERLKLDASSSLEKDLPTQSVSAFPSYSADVGRGVIIYPGPPFFNCAPVDKDWQGALFETTPVQKTTEADVFSSTTMSTGTLSPSDQPDFSCSNNKIEHHLQEQSIIRLCGPTEYPSLRISQDTVPCVKNGVIKSTYASEPSVGPASTTTASSFLEYQVCPTTPAAGDCIPNRSQIQEIIDKYTKDLRQAFDTSANFQVPMSGTVITDFEDSHFCPLQFSQSSSSHLFHSLTPKADFDISSVYSPISDATISSQDNKDQSKTVVPSIENQNTSAYSETKSSGLHEYECSMHSLPRSTEQDSPAFEILQSGQQIISADQSSGSFHPLQPESGSDECYLDTVLHTVTELPSSSHLSTETTSQLQTTGEFLPPAFEMTNEELPCPSEVLMESTNDRGSESTIENPRSQDAESLLQDSGSFDFLSVTPSTVNDSKHSFREGMEQTKMDFSFVEQRIVITGRGENVQKDGVVVTAPEAVCSSKKRENFKTSGPEFITDVSAGQQEKALQTLPGTVFEKDIECIDSSVQKITLHSNSLVEPDMKKSSKQAESDHFASLMSGCVPVWETETGKGIMEESELTLVSLSDSTLVAQEHSNVQGEDVMKSNVTDTVRGSEDPETETYLSRYGYQPSEAVAGQSIRAIQGSSAVNSSLCDEKLKKSVVMLLEFESQGNLQDAFLKKKSDFIQKCSKRVEQIKNRPSTRGQVEKTVMKTTEKSCFPPQIHSSSPATVQLKKVGEVKVSTPEDRKTSAVEMQQRTLRLYNQLSEVKQKKEEKTRREVYAVNREKAKEFQKKTLERLRAKKMH